MTLAHLNTAAHEGENRRLPPAAVSALPGSRLPAGVGVIQFDCPAERALQRPVGHRKPDAVCKMPHASVPPEAEVPLSSLENDLHADRLVLVVAEAPQG